MSRNCFVVFAGPYAFFSSSFTLPAQAAPMPLCIASSAPSSTPRPPCLRVRTQNAALDQHTHTHTHTLSLSLSLSLISDLLLYRTHLWTSRPRYSITLLHIKTSEGLIPFLPSTWVPNLYLLPYHSTSATQSRLGSRSHRRERASTCILRDACSPLTETPFQALSLRHGRWTAQVSRASKFDSSPSL